MVTIPIMRGSSGLNTQSDQARSHYSSNPSGYVGEKGIVDFSACMNIDISDKYRVSRRRAITRQATLDSHSIHPVENKYCLFVSGSNLNLLLPNFTDYVTVSTVTSGLALSCFVLDGVAYWSNGIEKGKIVDGANVSWAKGDVVSDNKTRVFYSPPLGQHLDFYNGRAYIADGPVVWYSEDYGPDVFSLGDSFLSFESDVTMVRHVAGGVYISDSLVTWFLSGAKPSEFDWRIVDNNPALKYSDKNAIGAMVEGSWQPGGKAEVAFWLTNEGIIYGDATGNITNTSEMKIDLPAQYTTGSILIDGSALIAQFI